MPYALESTEANRYITIPLLVSSNPGGSNVSWDVEFSAANIGSVESIVLGSSLSTDDIIILRSDNTIDFRINNDTETFTVTDVQDSTAVYRFELRWTGGTKELKLYENGILAGTGVANKAPINNLDQIFIARNIIRKGIIRTIKYTDNNDSTNNREYLNSTGTGTVWEDISGNNQDGTQAGSWPSDNSEWVFYSTGPDTPINPSVTNLLATSARLNWEQG